MVSGLPLNKTQRDDSEALMIKRENCLSPVCLYSARECSLVSAWPLEEDTVYSKPRPHEMSHTFSVEIMARTVIYKMMADGIVSDRIS